MAVVAQGTTLIIKQREEETIRGFLPREVTLANQNACQWSRARNSPEELHTDTLCLSVQSGVLKHAARGTDGSGIGAVDGPRSKGRSDPV